MLGKAIEAPQNEDECNASLLATWFVFKANLITHSVITYVSVLV